jgi:putative acetyltransferase
VTAAFGREAEADLVERVRPSNDYEPDYALVAEEEGAVVGHVMFSRITVATPEPVRVLGMAPVSVRPDRQRDGVGGALIRAGLDRADREGEPFVIVLGHPSYYPRFGFQPARPLGFEPQWPGADAAFMVKLLAADRPEWRGPVRYGPAFDDPQPPPANPR